MFEMFVDWNNKNGLYFNLSKYVKSLKIHLIYYVFQKINFIFDDLRLQYLTIIPLDIAFSFESLLKGIMPSLTCIKVIENFEFGITTSNPFLFLAQSVREQIINVTIPVPNSMTDDIFQKLNLCTSVTRTTLNVYSGIKDVDKIKLPITVLNPWDTNLNMSEFEFCINSLKILYIGTCRNISRVSKFASQCTQLTRVELYSPFRIAMEEIQDLFVSLKSNLKLKSLS